VNSANNDDIEWGVIVREAKRSHGFATPACPALAEAASRRQAQRTSACRPVALLSAMTIP
jgi:hypothetical protein